MKYTRSPLLACSLALVGGLAVERGYGADVVVTLNFNTDPAASGLYVETGNGAAYWSPNGGASGANGDGFLAINDARRGQASCLTFNDTPETAGLVVAAFKFEADLRIGGGTARPADGFSLNFVRNPSALLDTLAAGGNPVDANFNGTDNEVSLPEEGVREGLGIGFDTWESGALLGTTDVVGISVRYNQALVTQFPVPLQPGNLFPGGNYNETPYRNLATNDANYLSSMQTGALSSKDLNGDGIVDGADANTAQPTPDDPTWSNWIENLKWEKFAVEVAMDGKVKVSWKGVELTPVGGLPSGFTPGKGRIVFAGRTGDAWEAHHVDNIKLTLTPVSVPAWGGVDGNPVGFDTTIADSGPGVLNPATLVVKLDGNVVTPKSVTKDATGTTSIRVYDVAAPLVAGSTHTVNVTAKASNGQDVLGSGTDKTFVVPAYITVPAAYAATPDTSKPGFKIRWHQVTAGTETTVARAEQQLYGLRGPNLYLSPMDVEEVTGTINYEQAGLNAGNWNGTTDPAPTYAEVPLPLPDVAYTDNIAAAIETYIQFPEAGIYRLVFNSDDGFRTTIGASVTDVLGSINASEADVGRGSADTVVNVYIPTAGTYPVRTIWFEGGGGANLEWVGEEVLPTIMGRALLNDANRPSLKTFSARTDPAPAGVTFLHPFRGSGGPYLPYVPIIAELTSGASAINQGSIVLTLNGAAITPTITPGAGKFTLNYQSPTPLPAGTNTLKIEFTAGTQNYSAEHAFVVRNVPTIPPSLALPASVVNKAEVGFLIKTIQQDSGESMGTDTYRALVQAAGMIGWPNTVNPSVFTGPGGYYAETSVVNYDQFGGSTGFWAAGNGYQDANVPGIPGTAAADSGTDNYVMETLTVLDLQAGYYAMRVNSDDGFICTIGNPAEAFGLPVMVGEFNGGRGNGGGNRDGTIYYFRITQAGLYPVRLLYYEGGGGANIEWDSIVLDANGNLTSNALINDVNAAGHIKAYQYPLTAAGSPYVKSFKPGRSDRSSGAAPARAGRDTTVEVEIADGNGNINPATVTMTINGTAVSATATKTAGVTKVVYAPATPFGPNTTNNVVVTFGDRSVSWQFKTADIATPVFFFEAEDFNTGGGTAQAAASAMPYMGGAYAGLSAVHDVDYHRGGDENASPIYRMDEEPSVPMDRIGDRDRGFTDLAVNYKIGWTGGGQWFNYTRTFPAGSYNVYAGLSHGEGSGTTMAARLEKVVSPANVVNQTTEALGSFNGPGTGGWGNAALVPLRDAEGNMVALDLSGTQTLRVYPDNGDYDFVLFTLAPRVITITGATITGGQLTVTWTGGGTLESTPSLSAPVTWTSTGDSDGSYTAPVGATGNLFFRVKE